MVTIQVVGRGQYSGARIVESLKRLPLDSQGIRLSDSEGDIILTSQTYAGGALAYYPDKPVIVFENRDSGCLSPLVRHVIKNPRVVAVWKTSVLRPRSLYHRKHFISYKWQTGASLHNYLIYQTAPDLFDELIGPSNVVDMEPLTEQDLSKVTLAWTPTLCPNHESQQDVFGCEEWERAYDLAFIANVGYPDVMVTYHRNQALRAVKSLPVKKFIHASWGCDNQKLLFAPEDPNPQPMPFAEYVRLLRQSKICVSPWGGGQWCYRDFEAIACGCVVIKPQSDECECWPDIHKAGSYVPCAVDFSDLHEKVDHVLSHWGDYDDQRNLNRRLVLEARHSLLRRFKDLITEELDQCCTVR